VICNFQFATGVDVCAANVGGGGTAPAGSVAFTSRSGGSFRGGNTCTLKPTGANAASCTVNFVPQSTNLTVVTSSQIVASYAGDATHAASTGQTGFILAAMTTTAVDDSCSAASGSATTPGGVLAAGGLNINFVNTVPGGSVIAGWDVGMNVKASTDASGSSSCVASWDLAMNKGAAADRSAAAAAATKPAKATVLAQLKRKRLARYGRVTLHLALTKAGRAALLAAKRHHRRLRVVLRIRYTT
jgi:hypothetical protein